VEEEEYMVPMKGLERIEDIRKYLNYVERHLKNVAKNSQSHIPRHRAGYSSHHFSVC